MFSQLLQWFMANIGYIALVAFFWWHRKLIYDKFVFTPLAGGNGKIQMDELTKGIIVIIAIWCVRRDGYRTHEWSYFSDAFYFVLFGAVCAIAAIKPTLGAVSHVLKSRAEKTLNSNSQPNGEDTDEQHKDGTTPTTSI
jgi:hypothetical protein